MATTPATAEPVTLEDMLECIARKRATRFNDMLFQELASLRAQGRTEEEVREANEQMLDSFGQALREQLSVIASEIGTLLPRRKWN